MPCGLGCQIIPDPALTIKTLIKSHDLTLKAIPNLHFKVMVFRNRGEMLECAEKKEMRQPPNTEAFCHVRTVDDFMGRKRIKTYREGFLFFHKKKFGAGIVAHEIAHAVLFAHVKPVSPDPKKHEPFCLDIGNMNREFWNRWLRIVK